MKEGELILRVRVFTHSDIGEVMDTLVQKLIEANVAHWEVMEDKPPERRKRASVENRQRMYLDAEDTDTGVGKGAGRKEGWHSPANKKVVGHAKKDRVYIDQPHSGGDKETAQGTMLRATQETIQQENSSLDQRLWDLATKKG